MPVVEAVAGSVVRQGVERPADFVGCEAVKPKLCYFRIFYLPRQTRQVILPAGVKENIPGVDIGRDQYCMKIGGAPAYKCERKTITSKENN